MSASYSDLPPELRCMIVQHLIQDGCSLAPLATLSRQWAAMIEPYTFSRLRLTPARVPQLDAMTRRNRSRVRYLWLCLELDRYGCPACFHDHGGAMPGQVSRADDDVVARGVRDLFRVLAGWHPSSTCGRRGLTLDISVYSTSDSEHWFKYLSFVPDGLFSMTRQHNLTTTADSRPAHAVVSDQANTSRLAPSRHSYVTHGLGHGPPAVAISRLFNRMRGKLLTNEERTAAASREEVRRLWGSTAGEDEAAVTRAFTILSGRMAAEDEDELEEDENDSEDDDTSESESESETEEEEVGDENESDDDETREGGFGPDAHVRRGRAWWCKLPEVPAVTHLMLRQQTRRRWRFDVLVGLVSSLPRLRELDFEPWRELYEYQMQRKTDQGYIQLLQSPVIKNLTRLSFFENTHAYYAHAHRHHCRRPHRRPSRALAAQLYHTSQGLTQLSASLAIDAEHFFALVDPAAAEADNAVAATDFHAFSEWPNLRSVALTSRLLAPQKAREDIMRMLFNAATAARKMPRLMVMEIWNGREYLAAAFRYEALADGADRDDGKSAVLTWRATWSLGGLDNSVIRAWSAVAAGCDTRRRNGVRVVYEGVDPGFEIHSHADAVHTLRLRNAVMRPISTWQIRNEQWDGMDQGPDLIHRPGGALSLSDLNT